jgi:hypothetical protein
MGIKGKPPVCWRKTGVYRVTRGRRRKGMMRLRLCGTTFDKGPPVEPDGAKGTLRITRPLSALRMRPAGDGWWVATATLLRRPPVLFQKIEKHERREKPPEFSRRPERRARHTNLVSSSARLHGHTLHRAAFFSALPAGRGADSYDEIRRVR